MSHARTTGLTVRRLQNALLKNKYGVMLKDNLWKKGDSLTQKIGKRLVILTAKDLSWYIDETEFYRGKPIGIFPLEFIYNSVKSFSMHD